MCSHNYWISLVMSCCSVPEFFISYQSGTVMILGVGDVVVLTPTWSSWATWLPLSTSSSSPVFSVVAFRTGADHHSPPDRQLNRSGKSVFMFRSFKCFLVCNLQLPSPRVHSSPTSVPTWISLKLAFCSRCCQTKFTSQSRLHLLWNKWKTYLPAVLLSVIIHSSPKSWVDNPPHLPLTLPSSPENLPSLDNLSRLPAKWVISFHPVVARPT